MHFDFMHSEYMCYHDIFLLLTAVDCGTLNNPANGQVSHTGRTTYRLTATYSCDTGYNLVGVSTRTCQATGVWSGSTPTCQGMLLLKLGYYLLVLDMYTQKPQIMLVNWLHSVFRHTTLNTIVLHVRTLNSNIHPQKAGIYTTCIHTYTTWQPSLH